MSLLALNRRRLKVESRKPRAESPRLLPQPSPLDPRPSTTLAVIVTCHPAYLEFLPEALASVDTQDPPPAEKILVLDDCAISNLQSPISDSWKTISGAWHNPNPARNAGWRAATAPWLIFWDADDVMPPGYLAALLSTLDSRLSTSLAILYPTLTRGPYDSEHSTWNAHTPDWSYWSQRHQLSIQSGAAWSRAALTQVDGWDDQATVHDDGNLAARITALGFTACRLPAPVVKLRSHSLGHRWHSTDEERAAQLWRFRTLAIILPICRPRCLPYLAGKLATLDLPRQTSLVIVDNTPQGDAGRLLSAWNLGRFTGLQILRVPTQTTDTDRNGWERHQHISRMYNTAFAATRADCYFTWEDDVQIPDDAVRLLWEHFLSGSRVGGASGVYETAAAHQPGWVCASRDPHRWITDTRLEDAPTGPEDWAFIPLGCSLWAGHALRPCLPHNPRRWERGVAGGDAVMSLQMRQAGWRILLDGRVRCVHDWRPLA